LFIFFLCLIFGVINILSIAKIEAGNDKLKKKG